MLLIIKLLYFLLEFKSRLHVGFPGNKIIELSGGISRQYVGLNDPGFYRFFATKTNTPLKNILLSLGKKEPKSIIKNAKFNGTYIVAYNSQDEGKRDKLLFYRVEEVSYWHKYCWWIRASRSYIFLLCGTGMFLVLFSSIR